MKKLILVCLAFTGFLAFAGTEEIPYAETDTVVSSKSESRCFDCARLMVKKVTCDNDEFAVQYFKNDAWGPSSTLYAVCRWSNHSSAKDCSGDNDPATVSCYHKVVKYYGITRLMQPDLPVTSATPDMDKAAPAAE